MNESAPFHQLAVALSHTDQSYGRIGYDKVKDPVEFEAKYDVSIVKRCCGAGLIMTKLSKTTLGSIALSVLVANLFGVQLPRQEKTQIPHRAASAVRNSVRTFVLK